MFLPLCYNGPIETAAFFLCFFENAKVSDSLSLSTLYYRFKNIEL